MIQINNLLGDLIDISAESKSTGVQVRSFKPQRVKAFLSTKFSTPSVQCTCKIMFGILDPKNIIYIIKICVFLGDFTNILALKKHQCPSEALQAAAGERVPVYKVFNTIGVKHL